VGDPLLGVQQMITTNTKIETLELGVLYSIRVEVIKGRENSLIWQYEYIIELERERD
jgi:hypothetical protein